MTTAIRGNCEAPKHDTLWAWREHGCRCPTAVQARDQHNADRRVGAVRWPTTPRNLREQVAALTAQGRSTRQIAVHPNIHERTVERHRQATNNTPPTQPSTAAADPDWRSRAACINPAYDPGWWTTPNTRGNAAAEQRARFAINICNTCPVQQACATDPTDPRPLELIRAGIVYGPEGKPVPNCHTCQRPILCRNFNTTYCSDTCAGTVRRPRRVRGDRAWQPDAEAAA